ESDRLCSARRRAGSRLCARVCGNGGLLLPAEGLRLRLCPRSDRQCQGGGRTRAGTRRFYRRESFGGRSCSALSKGLSGRHGVVSARPRIESEPGCCPPALRVGTIFVRTLG